MAEKRPQVKDLRALPEADLQGQLASLRDEIWHQRQKAKDGSLKQTHLLRAAKRQVARVQTVLTERRHSGK